MGGPALHVAYLTAGLRERGYDTTLVAGSLARGEDSMAFVADARDVEIVRIDELGREISPLRDLVATVRLAWLIRLAAPARVAHPPRRARHPAPAYGDGPRRRPCTGTSCRPPPAAGRR